MERSSGFSVIMSLIVIGAIIVLGLISWRVSQSYTSTSSSTPSSNTAPSNAYAIEEWAVQFKPNDLENLIHSVIPVPPLYGIEIPQSTQAITFTTKPLADSSDNCRIGREGFTPLGTLYRTNSPLIGAESLLIKQIDNFSYYYKGPQAVCSNEANVATEQRALAKLQENLKTLEQKD